MGQVKNNILFHFCLLWAIKKKTNLKFLWYLKNKIVRQFPSSLNHFGVKSICCKDTFASISEKLQSLNPYSWPSEFCFCFLFCFVLFVCFFFEGWNFQFLPLSSLIFVKHNLHMIGIYLFLNKPEIFFSMTCLDSQLYYPSVRFSEYFQHSKIFKMEWVN